LEKNVPLLKVGRDVKHSSVCHDIDHQEFWVEGRFENYKVTLPLLGAFQMDNAAAAAAGLEALVERGFTISKDNIEKGLAAVNFPGRMQIVRKNPLIVLDGGHNPGAAQRLKESLLEYFLPTNTILVIGLSGDKDISGVIDALSPIFSHVITTRADNPRSISPEKLVEEFVSRGIQTESSANVSEAITKAISIAAEDDLICITGSLFVVGEALAYIRSLPNES
jgi:dihydrofolate synthase/folylpolyglutamate synthase